MRKFLSILSWSNGDMNTDSSFDFDFDLKWLFTIIVMSMSESGKYVKSGSEPYFKMKMFESSFSAFGSLFEKQTQLNLKSNLVLTLSKFDRLTLHLNVCEFKTLRPLKLFRSLSDVSGQNYLLHLFEYLSSVRLRCLSGAQRVFFFARSHEVVHKLLLGSFYRLS